MPDGGQCLASLTAATVLTDTASQRHLSGCTLAGGERSGLFRDRGSGRNRTCSELQDSVPPSRAQTQRASAGYAAVRVPPFPMADDRTRSTDSTERLTFGQFATFDPGRVLLNRHSEVGVQRCVGVRVVVPVVDVVVDLLGLGAASEIVGEEGVARRVPLVRVDAHEVTDSKIRRSQPAFQDG